MTFVPTVFGSGVAGYAFLQRTREQQQSLFEQNPLTTRETTQFAERMKDVQTSDELLEDRTLLKVALGAFGLDEDLGNIAFLKRILDSDLEDDRSLANRLADKRYLAFAETFNFAGEGGARLLEAQSADELTVSMQGLQSADDLLADRGLLRASLEKFGLEGNISNTYFLKQVLESDLSDENSFANRMPDSRLVDFAETFNFFQKEQDRSRLDDIVDVFSGTFDDVTTTEQLLAEPEMLEEALAIFDLDDVYTADFLTDVLQSDLNDDASFANTLEDERFALFAAAFNFNTPVLDDLGDPVVDTAGDPVFKQGTLEAFVNAAVENDNLLDTPEQVLDAEALLQASRDLYGIPSTLSSKQVVERVLTSDPEDPNSAVNVLTAEPYSALFNLFNFKEPVTTRTYPEGFVEQVTRNYLDRQFEIQVGERDPAMRVALSLERELTQLAEGGSSNDSKWFSIMASPPLRQAFEGALRLPSSFGSIDVDQQLSILKDRSETFFGTNEVDQFLEPDRLDNLRQTYLLSSSAQGFETASSANIASLILSNF
ncbi:hypothetical protein ROLI_040390 [Roseobacter fucihabitans]|uniref:Flagellar protein n=1 Tax=Roseobacter fucihabitans TaxID=1537242 RepID=A0ABZ2BYW0_9RHOB|nr:DUF1217 domain-containing protein [Roseobacter litoralis]MBC6965181.1 hypothetical protein [Roseobacter litoralis]MBC6965816.1 hypothetical protein [Roseobacter litoralis]